MDKKEIFNRIEYVVTCVGAFAQRFNLSNMQVYAYLRRFTGIDFLLDCYAAEHTLSIEMLSQTYKSFANGKKVRYDFDTRHTVSDRMPCRRTR